MGKISNVIYEEIDPNICSPLDSAELFYYMNLLGTSDAIREEYMKYEERQIRIRDRTIRAASEGGLPHTPLTHTSIFGASTLKNKTILITEIL